MSFIWLSKQLTLYKKGITPFPTDQWEVVPKFEDFIILFIIVKGFTIGACLKAS